MFCSICFVVSMLPFVVCIFFSQREKSSVILLHQFRRLVLRLLTNFVVNRRHSHLLSPPQSSLKISFSFFSNSSENLWYQSHHLPLLLFTGESSLHFFGREEEEGTAYFPSLPPIKIIKKMKKELSFVNFWYVYMP